MGTSPARPRTGVSPGVEPASTKMPARAGHRKMRWENIGPWERDGTGAARNRRHAPAQGTPRAGRVPRSDQQGGVTQEQGQARDAGGEQGRQRGRCGTEQARMNSHRGWKDRGPVGGDAKGGFRMSRERCRGEGGSGAAGDAALARAATLGSGATAAGRQGAVVRRRCRGGNRGEPRSHQAKEAQDGSEAALEKRRHGEEQQRGRPSQANYFFGASLARNLAGSFSKSGLQLLQQNFTSWP